MIGEYLKLAAKSFAGARLRTALSVLGIVIGIGSVITITTLGRSATASVQSQIAGAGLEIIAVFPGRNSDREVQRLFDTELASRMEREIEGAADVAAVNAGSFNLRVGNESLQAQLHAVDAGFSGMFNLAADRGRLLSAEDNQRRRTSIVLGAETAANLFGDEDPLGRYVRVTRGQIARSFKVEGVLRPKTDSMGMSFDTGAFIPFNTYSARIQKIETVQRYYIRAETGQDVLAVAEDVGAFFLALTGNADSFRVVSPATMAELFTGITQTLNLFLTGVAAISLLVGGIGIMNIMLVSVTERTREIGIRKALGAAPGVIRNQFLTEAVALTLLGGLIGMSLGLVLSYAGTMMLNWTFSPQPAAFALAIAFSSLVGVFFGWYPAVRAARLDPVQALSFE